MLYFVIPLRDRTTTKDWRGVCALLERTLASAAGQLHPDYRIVVMCHARPVGIEVPGRCEFVQVPFPPPVLSPDDTADRRLWSMQSDHGRKLLHGLAIVRKQPGAYVMFLDADDLVSNRLAGYVADHAGANGWYFDLGYRMDEHIRHVLFWRRNFFHECSSSAILRADLAPFPERLDDTLDLADYFVRRYVVHAYIPETMAKLGRPLEPLPFFGAVYTFNRQNIFATSLRERDSVWRRAARMLIKGRWITPGRRAEFGIRSVT